MGNALLFGASGDSYDGISSSNYFTLNKWTCSYNGTIKQIKVHCSTTGNIKLAIYADSAGEPAALIQDFGAFAAVAGWNTFDVTNVNVTAGTVYWLARNADAPTLYWLSGSSSNFRSKAGTYSGFTFPNPAGSGFSSDAAYNKIAAWGVLVVSPSGISQPIVYGSPKLDLILYPSGISQGLAYGMPTVEAGLAIHPSGIEQLIAIGTPEVIKLLQIISPAGIEQQLAYGTPALIYSQTLSPSSISVPISIGVPSVGIVGIIGPSGIAQLVAIGTPQLLKYVWHVILDGQYITESPDINRAYIIGRDANGSPVYGTAANTDEIALVGERLDFQQELAIPTEAQAGDVASAILSKMRLTGKRGVILIPPNCGQELFDVVQISDSGANQSAVKFRVVGIRFEYSPKQARYQHRLLLGAP